MKQLRDQYGNPDVATSPRFLSLGTSRGRSGDKTNENHLYLSNISLQDPENDSQPHFSVKVKISTEFIKIADSHSDVS